MRIRYQPDGDLTCSAESFVLIICNSVYPPLFSIYQYHNLLQNPIIKRFYQSAETNVSISFFSIAPLLMTRLSLGCLIHNCNSLNMRVLTCRLTGS